MSTVSLSLQRIFALLPRKSFQAVVSPVNKVTEEDIVSVGDCTARSEQLFQIVKLKNEEFNSFHS